MSPVAENSRRSPRRDCGPSTSTKQSGQWISTGKDGGVKLNYRCRHDDWDILDGGETCLGWWVKLSKKRDREHGSMGMGAWADVFAVFVDQWYIKYITQFVELFAVASVTIGSSEIWATLILDHQAAAIFPKDPKSGSGHLPETGQFHISSP